MKILHWVFPETIFGTHFTCGEVRNSRKKLKFQKPILSTIEDNGYSLIYKGCNALKWQEMDSNQSGTVGGTILGLFKGSLINLGASGWTAPKPKSGDSGADFDIP